MIFTRRRIFPAAAALCGRLAERGTEIPAALEPVERGIDRSQRDSPAGVGLDPLLNRHTVGRVPERNHDEQRDFLEIAEGAAGRRHIFLSTRRYHET